jgi:hypothetical protein
VFHKGSFAQHMLSRNRNHSTLRDKVGTRCRVSSQRRG